MNGVPSFLVKTNRHIQFLRLDSSDGVQSLPEAVAEDVLDILVKYYNDILKF